MTEELYHPLSLDPAAPTLCDGSIVLSTRLILLADLSQCVEWEFLTPGWLVWKPAWAQQNWSASWLPLELQVERGAPAKRLDLALRTDKSGDWLYAGEVTLMSHGWGSGSAPWSGEAHAAFRLSSPLGAGYWPELKHWNLKIDKRESDWSGSIHWPQEVEADWSEIELARRCGDALFLKRTGGRVYATYRSPSGATARGRSDYDWFAVLALFHNQNMLLPTARWRWSGDEQSAHVRSV